MYDEIFSLETNDKNAPQIFHTSNILKPGTGIGKVKNKWSISEEWGSDEDEGDSNESHQWVEWFSQNQLNCTQWKSANQRDTHWERLNIIQFWLWASTSQRANRQE